jgi:hypothetical protein
VWNAKANHLGTIIMPANMMWVDKDYHTLYITATTSVYRFRDENAGFCPLSAALKHRGQALQHVPAKSHSGSAKLNTSLPAEIATYWTPSTE